MRDDEAGNTVLVKHAVGAERERLRHEAALLSTARAEGVVALVGLDEIDDRCELKLRYVESAPLAEQPPLGLTQLLAVLLSIGETLSGIHALGICHGALNRDHVLVDANGSTILCGFGEATGPDDIRPDPAGHDLIALASLAAVELTRATYASDSSSERRFGSEARIACDDLAAAAASDPTGNDALNSWMVRIAHVRSAAVRESNAGTDRILPDRALSHDLPSPELGPQPSRLHDRLRAGISASQAPRESAHAAESRPTLDRSDRIRLRPVAIAAATVVLLVGAVVGWRALGGDEPDPPAQYTAMVAASAPTPSLLQDAGSETAPALVAHAAEAPAADVEPASVVEPAPAAEPDAALSGARLLYATASRNCADSPANADKAVADIQADLSGNGCLDDVTIAVAGAHDATPTITTPYGRWSVGTSGDLVTLGDWNCDGRATIALVHPDTGAVSFYASWPPTRAVLPSRTATVPKHPTAVEPRSTASAADSCDTLIVHYGDMNLEITARDPEPDSVTPLTPALRG